MIGKVATSFGADYGYFYVYLASSSFEIDDNNVVSYSLVGNESYALQCIVATGYNIVTIAKKVSNSVKLDIDDGFVLGYTVWMCKDMEESDGISSTFPLIVTTASTNKIAPGSKCQRIQLNMMKDCSSPSSAPIISKDISTISISDSSVAIDIPNSSDYSSTANDIPKSSDSMKSYSLKASGREYSSMASLIPMSSDRKSEQQSRQLHHNQLHHFLRRLHYPRDDLVRISFMSPCSRNSHH